MSVNRNSKPTDAFVDAMDSAGKTGHMDIAFRIEKNHLELFELSNDMALNLAKDIMRWLHIKELKL